MQFRAAALGDINLITLLMGAQGRGLQVQNHNGEWLMPLQNRTISNKCWRYALVDTNNN
jgi:isopenicillin N synthase-like dioxygenase